jgi:hypothetical protein
MKMRFACLFALTACASLGCGGTRSLGGDDSTVPSQSAEQTTEDSATPVPQDAPDSPASLAEDRSEDW